MLPTKFWSIWLSEAVSEEMIFLEINQSETISIEDFPMMIPAKFQFIWPSGYREDFLEINQSETRIVCGGHVC